MVSRRQRPDVDAVLRRSELDFGHQTSQVGAAAHRTAATEGLAVRWRRRDCGCGRRRQARRRRHLWPGGQRPRWPRGRRPLRSRWQRPRSRRRSLRLGHLHPRRNLRSLRDDGVARRPIEIATEQIPVHGAQHHVGHDTGTHQTHDAEHADCPPCHHVKPPRPVHEHRSLAPELVAKFRTELECALLGPLSWPSGALGGFELTLHGF